MTMTVSDLQISPRVKYRLEQLTQSAAYMQIGSIAVSVGTEGGVLVTGVLQSIDGISAASDPYLKWAGCEVYQRNIAPNSTSRIGLFEIHDDGVYGHDWSDNLPAKPLFTTPGSHALTYKLYATNGGICEFTVNLNYQPTTASLA